MLEIVVLHRLCRFVGRLSRAKGLPVLWFQALLIAAWFGGEVYGGVATALATTISAPAGRQEAPLMLMYASAIACGSCAAGLICMMTWIWPSHRVVEHSGNGCPDCGEPRLQQSAPCPMCGSVHALVALPLTTARAA